MRSSAIRSSACLSWPISPARAARTSSEPLLQRVGFARYTLCHPAQRMLVAADLAGAGWKDQFSRRLGLQDAAGPNEAFVGMLLRLSSRDDLLTSGGHDMRSC